jgi:hypothetical protein
MTQNSRYSTTNMYSEQPPTQKITPKIIFYVVSALMSIALWIQSLFVPSQTRKWLWDCGLFLLGLIIGSGSLVFSNFKKWWSSTQNIQEQQEMASSTDTYQQTFSILIWLYSILMMTFIVTLFIIVPSLTQNWLRVCGLFIIGSCGLILWDFTKHRLAAKKTRVQQETASSLDTSQRSFSMLMWLCTILEVALVAIIIVMLFKGNANDKELSGSLISGCSVGLFIWLAYRAYHYVDW